MKKYKLIFFLAVFALSIFSCSGRKDGSAVICTNEFRIIGVKVFGGKLTDFYTLRTATSDTIRFTDSGSYPVVNWYPILDDSFQTALEDTEEQFVFTGEINDTIVLMLPFVIGADKCHIFKASGVSEANL